MVSRTVVSVCDTFLCIIFSKKGLCVYMEYNYEEIGRIIKKERKKTGLSQDAFIQLIREKHGYSISRNTLSKIEKGKTSHYDCELLYILCDIFDCEMGYLLGEYECKTGRSTDISKETGLSETAIDKLQGFLHPPVDYGADIVREYPNTVSLLLEHKNAAYLISLITRRIKTLSQSEARIENVCGKLVKVDELELMDFTIQTELNSIIREISSTYRGNNAE